MTERALRRVLLVDDDTFILKLLSHMLRGLGFFLISEFTSALDASQAIAQRAASSDLIICDLNMPEMDGIEFIRRLASLNFRGAVIIVSGEDKRIVDTVEQLGKGQKFKILGHLQKPVSIEQLRALLRGWPPTAKRDENDPSQPRYGANILNEAIEHSELVNLYQPKVTIATGEVTGVECLVRWQHPTDGIIYPDSFIAVAEKEGHIDRLTHAVLEQALAQIKSWQNAGVSVQTAVNISMESLVSLDFPDVVAGLTREAGVQPHNLMLEVTESCLMHDRRAVLDILGRLRLKRFDLAIDDFGTGHSSLVQLRDLPFTQLKIDRGFVQGVHGDQTKQAIYSASVKMAKELGMEIVAEGVETREDWDYLKNTGCDMAQGYFVGRPMPAKALSDWISDWRRRFSNNFTDIF